MTLAFHYYITFSDVYDSCLISKTVHFLLIFRSAVPVFGHKIIAVFHSLLILYTEFFSCILICIMEIKRRNCLNYILLSITTKLSANETTN